jgi:3-deoxy-D-manno-octulosonate 8-phosphate phosphatase (KDO 8-P phosphatase)
MSDIKEVKILVIDIDGVLTDGKVWYTHSGERSKGFHSRDIRAIREFIANGFEVLLCTQSEWPGALAFADRTGATVVIGREKPVPKDPFIIVGDDTPDIELMKAAAEAYCPADADHEVKKYCTQLNTAGGNGCIAELANRYFK